MAWNSMSFDPSLVQTNSDAASSALAEANSASSAAAALGDGIFTPIAYIDNHTILVSEFGKTLTMAHADSKTFTLPSVGAEHDGAEVTLMRIGAGNMVVLGADADTVGGATDTQVTVTTLYGLVKLKYIHSTTTWAILWSKGSYTGA